ncbi:hypothetical protein BJ165DRAFT_1405757 [Panaeolus papilionaceus]|nr:hypothetical protein BJ165DRAFT_1405757 [Panaeolus papilionaceus]
MFAALRKHDQGGIRITDEVKKSKTRLKHIVAAESVEGAPEIADMSRLKERWRHAKNRASKTGWKSKGVGMISSCTTGIHQTDGTGNKARRSKWMGWEQEASTKTTPTSYMISNEKQKERIGTD